MATKSTSKSAASQGKSGQSFVASPSKSVSTGPKFAGSSGSGFASALKPSAAGGKGNLSASANKVSLPNAGIKLLASSNGGFTTINKGNSQKQQLAYGGPTYRVMPQTKNPSPMAQVSAYRNNIPGAFGVPRISDIVDGTNAQVRFKTPDRLGEIADARTRDAGYSTAGFGQYGQAPKTQMAALKAPKQFTDRIEPAAFTRPAYAAGNYFAPQAKPQRPTYAAGNYFPPSSATTSPTQSPMASQGPSFPGPYSPVASKDGFDAYKRKLQDTMLANYNRGLFGGESVAGADTLGDGYDTGWKGPQSGPETMPDPAGSPPMQPGQKYNVADSFTGNTNPVQERQPIPGWAEKIPGGLGMAASGLNWMANLPGDGPDRRISSNVQDRLPETIWDGSRSSGQLAQAPQMATGAVNPVAAAKTAPIGYSPQQYLYPQYTQGWAPLPRGLYGFKA